MTGSTQFTSWTLLSPSQFIYINAYSLTSIDVVDPSSLNTLQITGPCDQVNTIPYECET